MRKLLVASAMLAVGMMLASSAQAAGVGGVFYVAEKVCLGGTDNYTYNVPTNGGTLAVRLHSYQFDSAGNLVGYGVQKTYTDAAYDPYGHLQNGSATSMSPEILVSGGQDYSATRIVTGAYYNNSPAGKYKQTMDVLKITPSATPNSAAVTILGDGKATTSDGGWGEYHDNYPGGVADWGYTEKMAFVAPDPAGLYTGSASNFVMRANQYAYKQFIVTDTNADGDVTDDKEDFISGSSPSGAGGKNTAAQVGPDFEILGNKLMTTTGWSGNVRGVRYVTRKGDGTYGSDSSKPNTDSWGCAYPPWPPKIYYGPVGVPFVAKPNQASNWFFMDSTGDGKRYVNTALNYPADNTVVAYLVEDYSALRLPFTTPSNTFAAGRVQNHDAVYIGGTWNGQAQMFGMVDTNNSGFIDLNEWFVLDNDTLRLHPESLSNPRYSSGDWTDLEMITDPTTGKMFLITTSRWQYDATLGRAIVLYELADNGYYAGQKMYYENRDGFKLPWRYSSEYASEFDPNPVGEIPEPATLLLMGTGALGALGWLRRRRMV